VTDICFKRVILVLALQLAGGLALAPFTVGLNAQTSKNKSKIHALSCVPAGFGMNEFARSEANQATTQTLGKTIIGLGARCYRGKLVDRKLRQIRLFRDACWGNPPADYLEIIEKQREELVALRKEYLVIEIVCDPRSIVRNLSDSPLPEVNRMVHT